jgi:hypothetical protein
MLEGITDKKMKTTLVFALLFGCVIPTYSQINNKHRTDPKPGQFPKSQFKNDYLESFNFADKFTGPWNDLALADVPPLPSSPELSKTRNGQYSGDHMPCFKPEGIFSAKILRPDSTMKYTMPVKKYIE